MSDWEPEPAELREGETPDVSAHAQRNIEMLRQHLDDPESDYTEEEFEAAKERIIQKEDDQ